MQTTGFHRSPMLSAARGFLPVHLHPQPRVTVPCRRAPALAAVSARPRRSPRRGPSWDDDGSGDEVGVDESFFGEARDDKEEPEEPEEEPAGGRRRPASPAPGQLRGSDVLRALQRATAAKEEAKKKKKMKSAAARPAARRQEKGSAGGVKAAQVVGEVRPIQIRREWAPRIRELELRVQHLVDKYHHRH